MTNVTIEPDHLTDRDLADLGITCRGSVEAFRHGDDTVIVVVDDEHGSYHIDPPNEDHSGADAWEWIGFSDGYERNGWIEGQEDIYWFNPATDFWIEKYEHGLVRYAPSPESSAVDRQWDVSPGVAILRFTKPEDFGVPLIEVARAICEEYTNWCNGQVYGLVTYERELPPRVDCPVPLPYGLAAEKWVETDACWGFLGYEWATEAAATRNY